MLEDQDDETYMENEERMDCATHADINVTECMTSHNTFDFPPAHTTSSVSGGASTSQEFISGPNQDQFLHLMDHHQPEHDDNA